MDPGGDKETVQQAGQADSDGTDSEAQATPLAKTTGTRSRDEMLEENVIGTLARGFRVTVRTDPRCTVQDPLTAQASWPYHAMQKQQLMIGHAVHS